MPEVKCKHTTKIFPPGAAREVHTHFFFKKLFRVGLPNLYLTGTPVKVQEDFPSVLTALLQVDCVGKANTAL